MKDFKNIDDVLDFAIESEQQAVEFYNDLASKARNEDMKKTFVQFAQEEIGHKAKLVKVKEEKIFSVSIEKIADLKIADYIERVEASPNMTYQDALILAMKREKAAFRLYTSLAGRTDDPQLKSLFLSLAQEESKHKLMFEIEYDEFILREN